MTYLLLLLFSFYLPFQLAINPANSVDLASGRIFVILLFFFWVFESLKSKKFNVPLKIQTVLLLSFLFLNIFSIFEATNIIWSLRKSAFLLSFFPIFFIVSGISWNQLRLLNLFKFITYGAVLSATIGIFQFSLQFFIGIDSTVTLWSKIITLFLGDSFSQAVFTNPSWLVNISGATLLRSVSFFPDPHMFAYFLNITFFISLSIYLTKKSSFFLFTSIIILIADFLTFSRGGYLGLFSGFFFLFLFSFKNLQVKQKVFSLSLLFIFLLFLALPNPFTNRLYSSFNLKEGSNMGRIETWKQSVSIIKGNPLLGVGIGNYPIAIKPTASYREPIYSHNLYLDIASETGLMSAFLWISLTLAAIVSLFYSFLRYNSFLFLGAALGIIAFSVHSFFETPLYSIHILPLILILFALSSSEIIKRNQSKK